MGSETVLCLLISASFVPQSGPSSPDRRSSHFNLITLFDWLQIQTTHAETILLFMPMKSIITCSLPSSRLKNKQAGKRLPLGCRLRHAAAHTKHSSVKAAERGLPTRQEILWQSQLAGKGMSKKTTTKKQWWNRVKYADLVWRSVPPRGVFWEGSSFGGTPSLEYCGKNNQQD